MSVAQVFEKVTSVRALLLYILISIWLFMILIVVVFVDGRIDVDVGYPSVSISDYNGETIPVAVTNNTSSSNSDVMPVEIVNTFPVDVNIANYNGGEIPVSVENEFFDPVPIEVR